MGRGGGGGSAGRIGAEGGGWVCVCVGASAEIFVSSLFTHHQDSAAYTKSMGSTVKTLGENHGFAACAIAKDDNCEAMCMCINMYTYVHTHKHIFTYINT